MLLAVAGLYFSWLVRLPGVRKVSSPSAGSVPALIAIAVLSLKDHVGKVSQQYITEVATALKDPSVFAGDALLFFLYPSLIWLQTPRTSQSLLYQSSALGVVTSICRLETGPSA